MRALLKLDASIPPEVKTALKAISRILAPYRDAQVNIETHELLLLDSNTPSEPELDELLRNNPFHQHPAPDSDQLQQLDQHLLQLEKEFGISRPEPDDLLSPIKGTYKSGRKALLRAATKPTSESLHAWRKKTKRLWYQLRFIYGESPLPPLPPLPPHHPVNTSDHLGKSLGEIHDLDVLNLLIHSQATPKLLALMNTKRLTLLQQALEAAEKLFDQNPSTFSHQYLEIKNH